eukprot:3599811-Pyramimonas_sp.AAC.1
MPPTITRRQMSRVSDTRAPYSRVERPNTRAAHGYGNGITVEALQEGQDVPARLQGFDAARGDASDRDACTGKIPNRDESVTYTHASARMYARVGGEDALPYHVRVNHVPLYPTIRGSTRHDRIVCESRLGLI